MTLLIIVFLALALTTVVLTMLTYLAGVRFLVVAWNYALVDNGALFGLRVLLLWYGLSLNRLLILGFIFFSSIIFITIFRNRVVWFCRTLAILLPFQERGWSQFLLPLRHSLLSVVPHIVGNEFILFCLRATARHETSRCLRRDLSDSCDIEVLLKLFELLSNILDVFIFGLKFLDVCLKEWYHLFVDLSFIFLGQAAIIEIRHLLFNRLPFI